jgi:hypothetical protein
MSTATPTIVISGPLTEDVNLRTPGFESRELRYPSWSAELDLRRFYAHPARANASAFVDELLAACLVPRAHPREVAALPETDRARLRRALVAVCSFDVDWRRLHGSHLTPDERLFTLMLWRHRRGEAVRARVAERLREVFAIATVGAPDSAALVPKLPAHVRAAWGRPPTLTHLLSGQAFKFLVAYKSPLLRDPSKHVPVVEPPKVLADASRVAAAIADRFLPGGAANVLAKQLQESVLAPSAFKPFEAWRPPWLETALKGAGLVPMGLLGEQQPAVSAVMRLVNPQFAGAGALTQRFGFGVPSNIATTIEALGGQRRALEMAETWRRLLEPLRGVAERAEVFARFLARWEQRAFWFLLSRLGWGAAQRLYALDEDEVEDAVLRALEAVVTDGEFIPALRAEVAKAPLLNHRQRVQLDHVLEHAAEGTAVGYIKASASLHPALEGAFWEAAARVRQVVTPERRWAHQPTKKAEFETVVKRLGLEQEFQTLMVRELYGTAGNPFRHGSAVDGDRRQVLLGIAALCGWLEEFAGIPALDVLSTRLDAALPAAIEHAQPPALPPPSPN